jgi:hypothetical protein
MATLFIVLDPAPVTGARLKADNLVEFFRISGTAKIENHDFIYWAYSLLRFSSGRTFP